MLYDDAFCRAGEIAVWHVGLTFFISGRKRVADLQHVLFLRREIIASRKQAAQTAAQSVQTGEKVD